jgi:phosphoserine aminotransferase
LIYAGAQKNMGPAGTTLIVVKEEILAKQVEIFQVCWITPNILSRKYVQHPCFPVYASLLTLQWLKI